MKRWATITAIVLLLFAARGRAEPADLASRVILVTNSEDPDSITLARHYAEVRGVPSENILEFKMPLAEEISRAEFTLSVLNPLQEELVKRGWIDAIVMNEDDELGRHRIIVSGHKISYLIVFKGVPLKIRGDGSLEVDNAAKAPQPFKTNAGSVEGELALIAQSPYPITGFIQNPLFAKGALNAVPYSAVVKVTRLDGPTASAVRAMIDSAVRAEKEGLIGRAYVDIGGPHAQGDVWFREALDVIRQMDFSCDVDEGKGRFTALSRFDQPALYFGWYAGQVDGPFVTPDFRFPPGALALHLHSFSANTIRSTTKAWVGPLIARGVTGTWGNVYEPYLQLTHYPQNLLKAFQRGLNFGDATYEALPALSWQGIAVGDPLYRPFAMPLDEQIDRLEKYDPARASYVIERWIQQKRSSGNDESADSLLLGRVVRDPTLPLVIDLAKRHLEKGDKRAAASSLGMVMLVKTWRNADLGLYVTGAELLSKADDHAASVRWYARLLEDDQIALPDRKRLLEMARDEAKRAMDFVQADKWAAERVRLDPPKTE